MFWLLVVHMLPMPAENVVQDDPNRDSTMPVRFKDNVTIVDGACPSLAACQARPSRDRPA